MTIACCKSHVGHFVRLDNYVLITATVATIDVGLKEGGVVPLSRSAGNPSNTMWPTSMFCSVVT